MESISKDVNTVLNSVSGWAWWGAGSSSSKTDSDQPPAPPPPGDASEQPVTATTTDGAEAASEPPSAVTQATTDSDNATKQEESPPKNPEGDSLGDSHSADDGNEEKKLPTVDIDLEEMSKKAVSAAKDWGTYFFSVGKTATQQMTDQVTKTAKQLKDTIDDKTMIGDFNKLQCKFIGENTDKKKKSEASVAPWIGYNEEDAMKSQIMALSADKRNFLRNPPAGVQFNFDFEASFPVAMAMLQEDDKLKEMRFDLVPKQVQEDVFWRNYFYRVSLIKQSAQLTSLAKHTGSTAEPQARPGSADAPRDGSPSAKGKSRDKSDSSQTTKSRTSKDEEKFGEDVNAGSPAEHEFISDTFQENQLSEDEIKKEMQQLGMTADKEDDIPEWERELQAELQEYEVVNDGNDLDDNDDLEQEILDQLEAESNGEGGT